jgi:transposase-like protein
MAGLKDRPEVMRLEVVDTGRRRRWTEEEKLRIVTESLSGPRLGLLTARRYGIARSLLATWRRQFGVQGQAPRGLSQLSLCRSKDSG